jgi:hypothetical protein
LRTGERGQKLYQYHIKGPWPFYPQKTVSSGLIGPVGVFSVGWVSTAKINHCEKSSEYLFDLNRTAANLK